MELEKAKEIAVRVVEQFSPHCEKIKVAGSIRRQRPEVNDIDLVLIPSDRAMLDYNLMSLGKDGTMKMSGPKIARVAMKEIDLDVYYATEEIWATLLLIRTGSKKSNIRLATAAQRKGWRLAASGDGLFNEKEERIAGDTEQSIFSALGIHYLEPWERD